METFQKFLISNREVPNFSNSNFLPTLMTTDIISGGGVFCFIQKLLN